MEGVNTQSRAPDQRKKAAVNSKQLDMSLKGPSDKSGSVVSCTPAIASSAPVSVLGALRASSARPALVSNTTKADTLSSDVGNLQSMDASPKPTQYDQLLALTTIVEDTSEIFEIERHRPFAATTNPTLVAKAAGLDEYADIVEEAIAYGKKIGGHDIDFALRASRNCLFAKFGKRILDVVPGDVSTEVDACLSFNVDAQVETARELVRIYAELGVDKNRVLIKMAATWEGVQACRILESEGIRCNMTLLFNLTQAVAAADAGAFLISPFVGRVMDWYKAKEGVDGYEASEDPGVLALREIYKYYKSRKIKTVVMGASFRNLGEILELAGCDRLTISPKFIDELKGSTHKVARMLEEGVLENESESAAVAMDEASFRWAMCQDVMATEKLHEGIRGFAADLEKLDAKLRTLMEG